MRARRTFFWWSCIAVGFAGCGSSSGSSQSPDSGADSSGAGQTDNAAASPDGAVADQPQQSASDVLPETSPSDTAMPPATNPAADEYGTRAPMLAPNSEMAIAAVGEKVFVLGGYPASRVTQST